MVNVFITIDTECSIGGALNDPNKKPVSPERAILGRVDSSCYGTPPIMDILERNGLRGTFFVEVLASQVVDRQQITDAYAQIVSRGHDTQLHLHPVYHYYRLLQQDCITRSQLPEHPDLIGTLPLSDQVQLLREGIALFRAITGKSPVAFRAGGYGANQSTLTALSQVGIDYDSSFNAAAVGRSCFIDAQNPSNIPWRVGPVWEVPLTNFRVGFGAVRGFKPLDVAGVSWLEIMRVLNSAERSNSPAVVVILHSFSFLKRKDVQFEGARADHLVIKRFEELCKYLKRNAQRFRVTTFGDRPQFNNLPADQLPNLGWLLPAGRKLVQAVNRVYWV